MKEQKKILLPSDFSDCAFNAMRYAIQFADKYEGEFTIDLLHVIYPEIEPVDFPTLSNSATRQKIEWAKENLKNFTATSIAQIEETQKLKYVPDIEPSVEIGAQPSNVITRIAERDGYDLIIMGTQGETNSFEKVFGTTASATIRKSNVPTLVIPKDFNMGDTMTLAYATDLTKTDPYHIWEVNKFFEPFYPITRVVHINDDIEAHEIQMKNLEDFFRDQVPGLQITFHNIPAVDVVKGLQDFTTTWDVNLLVLPRKHRNFFEQLLRQSVTKQTVMQPYIPTLIIPD